MMGRWIVRLWFALGVVATTGAHAIACSPPPAPDWMGWIENPATDIFVGRVTSETALPDATVHGIPLKRAMLSISRVASYRQRTGPETVDATIVIEVLDPAHTEQARALCLYPEPYRTGDLLLVMQSPDDAPRLFSRVWVGQSQFTPLFETTPDAQ